MVVSSVLVRFIRSFVFVECERLRIDENVLLFVYFWMFRGFRVNDLRQYVIRMNDYYEYRNIYLN